jgi:amidase
MNRRLSLILLGVCLSTGVFAAADARSPAGRWLFHFVKYGEEYASARVELQVDGRAVTGSLNELKIAGTFKDGLLSFHATRPNGSDFGLFEGRLVRSELRGVLTNGGNRSDWIMQPLPSRPATPRVHVVDPKQFSRLFSSMPHPVARIHPGDRVKTWTLDAAGFDKAGVRLSFGGNPQTGPFYVEGAVPGDMLVVKLERIALNRDSARSGTRLVPQSVTGEYDRNAKYDTAATGDWILDRNAMTGRIADASERMKEFRVRLAPFLGGIGVAPPDKQAIDARALGSYGGNLDYNRLTEGTVLYLPVYSDGALLFVGDGHAAQGAGELTGDALETSMDVEFSIDLIEGKNLAAPRAENRDSLMAMGIAGNLQDATRFATTGLADWLAEKGLTSTEIALLMGVHVEYDIAELVSSQFNVVARIGKADLPVAP